MLLTIAYEQDFTLCRDTLSQVTARRSKFWTGKSPSMLREVRVTRGLSKRLAQGIPRLNSDMSVTIYGAGNEVIETLPAVMFTNGGIGYFYERVVGLNYERAGYAVEYRYRLGFLDRGVDLIARKPSEHRFVQCKFTLKSMPVAKVERLLAAASTFVAENLCQGQNHFDLVVPFEEVAFPVRKSRSRAKEKQVNAAKLAFQRYNTTQPWVRLHIVEIPVDVPEDLLHTDVAYD